MIKKKVALYYAPLRPYVNRYTRRLGRFLWDWVPDLLVIFVSVWCIMQIWEFAFWH